MLPRRSSFPIANAFVLGFVLMFSEAAIAQRHGGGHGGLSGGIPGGSNRPTGIDEKDALKDFHQALAVQATVNRSPSFRR
jgi:hypothetical protein